MNEKDFEYLNNIDTRPGPNAGRSIDPTKHGPDADAAALAQSDAELAVAWRETLMAARDEIISLLPEDWFENGFLKEPHPVIDKIDTALTAPPRPNASAGFAKEIEELQRENKVLRAITRGAQKADASAGLIEAAEMAEKEADRWAGGEQYALETLAAAIRARAATDRSGK